MTTTMMMIHLLLFSLSLFNIPISRAPAKLHLHLYPRHPVTLYRQRGHGVYRDMPVGGLPIVVRTLKVERVASNALAGSCFLYSCAYGY